MVQTVPVETSTKKYNVIIGAGLNYGEEILKVYGPCKVMLVSDDRVFSLYGEKCRKELMEKGFEVVSFVFPNGEISKTPETALKLYRNAAEAGISRSDLFVALGGGVTGDLTGFVAATFLRGVRFIQLPTTILAAVDSSVGGKTAVDLPEGKNLVGAFYQPELVVCDTDTFQTLTPEIYADGMAEAIKYGMIWDEELFELFEQKSIDINEICARCVAIKAKVVGEDEFDLGLRKILNFGHTIGHAIEKLSNYQISHGSAVAIGMVMITRSAEVMQTGAPGEMTARLINTLKSYNLPTSCEYEAEAIAALAKSDKKREGAVISAILPQRIGEVKICDMRMDEWNSYVKKGV